MTKINPSEKILKAVPNDSFAFIYKDGNNFAIDSSILFENLHYNKNIAKDGTISYSRKYCTEVFSDKIVDAQISPDGCYMLRSKKCVYCKSYTSSFTKKFEVPNYVDSATGATFGDFIKDVTLVNQSLVYVLTTRHKIYKVVPKTENSGYMSTTITLPLDTINPIRIWNGWYSPKETETLITASGHESDTIDTTSRDALSGIYVLDSDNVLYFFRDWYHYYQDIIPECDGKIVEIRSWNKKSFAITANGMCYVNGTLYEDEIIYGFEDYIEAHYNDADDDCRYTMSTYRVKDVSIGTNHHVILYTAGIALGFGDTTYGQLGIAESDDTRENKNIPVYMEYKNKSFYNVLCNSYGTVFSTYDGKIIFTGVLKNYELGFNNNVKDITINGTTYSYYLSSNKLIKCNRLTFTRNGATALGDLYVTKLFNTMEFDVIIFTTDNLELCVSGGTRNTKPTVMTDFVTYQNASGESKIDTFEVDDRWTYFEHMFMRLASKYRNDLLDILYKDSNGVWIHWMDYVNKYRNAYATLKSHNIDGKIYEEYNIEGERVFENISYDAYIEYLPYVTTAETDFAISNLSIPELTYIDSNHKVWKINKCDNLSSYIRYTEDDYKVELDNLNKKIAIYKSYVSDSSTSSELKKMYTEFISYCEDCIRECKGKIGQFHPSKYLDMKSPIIGDTISIYSNAVTTKKKNTHASVTEDVENDTLTLNTTTTDGVTTVTKITGTAAEHSIIHTPIDISVVDLDYINNPKLNMDKEFLRDDIGITVNVSGYDASSYLFWISGSFVNKDYISSDGKTAYVKNGISKVNTRRICESVETKVTLANDENATVEEPLFQSEYRYDIRPKAFGWKNVVIDGPYSIQDSNHLNCELSNQILIDYFDVNIRLYNSIKFINKKLERNTFMLFLDGIEIPNSEYNISYDEDSGNTTITLKTFADYLLKVLNENVKITDPGYKGHVEEIVEEIVSMENVSIAFISSDNEYKKAKFVYDVQNIKNYPKISQVTFQDVSYGDLVLIDGVYVPYNWVSENVIEYPETKETIRTTENNFLTVGNVYKVGVYECFKNVDDLTDVQCKNFVKEYLLDDQPDVYNETHSMNEIRTLIAKYIAANNHEI